MNNPWPPPEPHQPASGGRPPGGPGRGQPPHGQQPQGFPPQRPAGPGPQGPVGPPGPVGGPAQQPGPAPYPPQGGARPQPVQPRPGQNPGAPNPQGQSAFQEYQARQGQAPQAQPQFGQKPQDDRQANSQPPQFVKQSPTGPRDFTQPVELKCVIDLNKTMARFIPICLLAGFLVFAIVGVGLGFAGLGAVGIYVGGIAAGLAFAAALFFYKRSQVRRVFAEKQRLRLTPHGMVKVDGTVQVDMPWAGLSRVEVRNSALASGAGVSARNLGGMAANAAIGAAENLTAAGLVGQAVLSPLPGASKKVLAAHDRSGGSSLRLGQPHHTPQGLIFPAEFEKDWVNGEVGAWLRHYRPDLNLGE